MRFLLFLFALLPAVSFAATVNIVDPEDTDTPFQITHYHISTGPSSYYGPGGSFLLVQIPYVDPDGKVEDGDGNPLVPTTGYAVQNGTVINLNYEPTSVAPHAYTGATNDVSLTDAWTVTLENDGDTPLVFTTPTVDTSNLAPELSGAVLSDLGTTTPTLTWEAPDTIGDFIDVVVYDLENVNEISGVPAVVEGGFFRIDPDATQFAVPDGLLEADHFYSFNLSSVVLRDDGQVSSVSGISLDGAYESLNSSFYDFYTGDYGDGIVAVVLPEVDTSSGSAVFNFDNAVEAGVVQFYDPVVAVGYLYEIGESDPNFRSFVLPDIGDGNFELYLWDEDMADYIFEVLVSAGSEYFFDTEGVDRFKILGIEIWADLDPEDSTAFATGISFVSDGRFTGTMTPIAEEVDAVPLPASLPLILAALGILGMAARRGRPAVT